MDERAQAIAEDIESGAYFAEARHWYSRIFVYPLRAYALMRMVSYAAIVLALAMAWNVYSVFPLVTQLKVIARVNNTSLFYPVLLRPSDSKKTTKQFITESLAAKYVNARESYQPERYKTNYNFLLKSSSKKIFDDYYSYITSKKAESPLNLYLKKQVVKVRVLKTELALDANKVTVTFGKDIFNVYGEIQSSSRWKADIEFYLSKYDFSKSVEAKLDFIVTNYTVSEVKTT
jgi:type IV secretory pathway component VirB8